MQKYPNFVWLLFRISVSWDHLVVSRLPISFKASSLVTWEKLNIELFLYLSSIVKALGISWLLSR